MSVSYHRNRFAAGSMPVDGSSIIIVPGLPTALIKKESCSNAERVLLITLNVQLVGSMEAPSKAFLLLFLLPDWLKLNHLKSRMECGFSDIFSRHTCSTVAASFGAKKCSENHI